MNYLFHSNYPYFEALHLGRFVRGLARMEWKLMSGVAPTQQQCHVVYSAGDIVFKDTLFDPGVSAEEFENLQTEKARHDALSQETREREMEGLAEKLRSGDIDFEDSEYAWRRPVQDTERVVEFVTLCRDTLRRFARFAMIGESLVEDMAAAYVNGSRKRTRLRGICGLLTAWDPMRMQHEGRPPYTLSFAPSFAESLTETLQTDGPQDPDTDAILERLSGEQEYQMGQREIRVARAGIRRGEDAGIVPSSVANAMRAFLDANKPSAGDEPAAVV